MTADRRTHLRLAGVAAALVLAGGLLVLVVVNVAATQALSGEPVTSGVVEDVRDELGDSEALVPVELVATVLTGLERRANDRALDRVREASLVAVAVLVPLSAAAGWGLSSWIMRTRWRPGRRESASAEAGPGEPVPARGEPVPARGAPATSPGATFRRLVEEASHELRNPLAVVTTNLDLVVSAPPDADPGEVHRAAQSALRAARRMGATLDGLTTSALAGGTEANEPVELGAVVASVAEEFSPPAAARGLTLTRVKPDAEGRVRGDRLALRRALANLVANAVRLAPAGSQIRVGAGTDGHWAWCGVADEGPGLATDQQTRVFDRGWRGEGGGAGLGLWIVRQVAESHGGCVRVHSALGVGTHLVVWLPSAEDGDRPPDPPATDPFGAL